LHERELLISDTGLYKIKNSVTNEQFPLLFFHFSGFDPFNPTLVNRRHPKYNTTNFPSFISLFREYVENEYANGYELYSKLIYSFNAFEDGENILPIHRRLFRVNELHIPDNNPFCNNSSFRKILKMNRLLTGIKSSNFSTYTSSAKTKKNLFEGIVLKFLKLLKRIMGIRYYSSLIIFLQENTRLDKQNILIDKKGEFR